MVSLSFFFFLKKIAYYLSVSLNSLVACGDNIPTVDNSLTILICNVFNFCDITTIISNYHFDVIKCGVWKKGTKFTLQSWAKVTALYQRT